MPPDVARTPVAIAVEELRARGVQDVVLTDAGTSTGDEPVLADVRVAAALRRQVPCAPQRHRGGCGARGPAAGRVRRYRPAVPTAQASARWRDGSDLWLDHVRLREADAAWMEPVSRLTVWAVEVPPGLLAALPHLRCLDVRGGSGSDLAAVEGCTGLRCLQVNQVRGLADLTVVPTLTSLRLLSLFGLPRVRTLPSLAGLHRLERLELGSMEGLVGLTGAHDAPSLRELLLLRAVGLAADDAGRLAAHPALQQFDWVGEDVPDRTWQPFVAAVGKAQAQAVHADEWLRQHGHL